jgi:hypothetical protein
LGGASRDPARRSFKLTFEPILSDPSPALQSLRRFPSTRKLPRGPTNFQGTQVPCAAGAAVIKFNVGA